MMRRICMAVVVALTAPHAQADKPRSSETHDAHDDAVYQLAPSAALARGLLEGSTTFRQVLHHGDFGLGALSPLDGEVMVLDGEVYHADHDGGRLRKVAETERTPFVFVKQFNSDQRVQLSSVDSYDDFARQLDQRLASPNLLYAVRIDGVFDHIKLRSVPRQRPPYPPIDEVVRSQAVFEASSVRGTIVAFRFPAYLGSISGSGYHMHFVDADRKLGGHVLDLRGAGWTVSVDDSSALTLLLPDDAAFREADFSDVGNASDAFRRAVRPDEASAD